MQVNPQYKSTRFARFKGYRTQVMTKSPFITATQFILSGKGLRRVAAFLLFPGFLLLPARSQVGLPRAAVSIPTDRNLVASLETARQCQFPGKLIVLPPVHFQLAGDESSSGLFEEQAQAVLGLPQESEVWLHIVAEAGSLTGKESEKQLTDRVEAFL